MHSNHGKVIVPFGTKYMTKRIRNEQNVFTASPSFETTSPK